MLPGWLRLCLCALILCGSVGASAVPGAVVRLQVDGVIGPASADYLVRGLAKAVDEGAQLVLIEIDTPGGLDSSMRAIIKAILASPIPVASYVAPGGARAASAGTYILYASHVAAMAPWTNLAAATPVAIGMPGSPSKPEGADKGETDKPAQGERGSADVMTAKQVNDAAAYIRGLANMRGRNAEWAEQAVREAVSLSAEEALAQKVIDYLATDLSDLLRQLDGKTLQAAGVEVTLATAGAPLISHAPDWRTRLLAVITNPSVALILMMIGVYGLFFEFSNPGSGIGGVLGGISLILALYALQLLPVNYAGVALILLGIDVPGFGIPLALIVTLALTSAGLILAILGMALKARRRQQVAGDSSLVGSLVAFADPQGGERLFREGVAPLEMWLRDQPFLEGQAPGGCDYLLAGMLFWAWCLGAQPWAEDSALGVWFARILQTYETTHGPVKRAAIHLEENP